MNYGDVDVPFTRITEHKHFAPWESHEGSVLLPRILARLRPGRHPLLPDPPGRGKGPARPTMSTRAAAEAGVTFVGRLGTYRYLDMDVTIREALDCGRRYLATLETGEKMPAFTVNPL